MGGTCLCILMRQYRILGLESLGGATVNRVGVISGRLPVFWTASGLTWAVLGSFWLVFGASSFVLGASCAVLLLYFAGAVSLFGF